jgi:PKD repeat protein
MTSSTTRVPAPARNRTFRLAAALVVSLLALGAGLGSGLGPGAGAVQNASHDGTLVDEDRTASWTPHALDGYVESIAEVGDTVVVGGNFSQIASAADRNTPIDQEYLFSFQKNSGTINSNFSPQLNGEVTSVLPTGDGQTVFVAGGFNNVNGETVRNLAKLNLATGQRVTSFSPPAFNGRIHDIHLRNGKLYVTGRFTTAGGQPRTLLAAVDPLSGALDPDVRADFADPRNGGFLTINASDVTPDGSKMVVTGNFTTVNGQGRYQIAQLDLTTSPSTVTDWSTNRYGDGCFRVFDTYMRDVEYSPDGSKFGVVTTGAYAAPGGYLCDTIAGWDATAAGADQQPLWTNYSGGDTMTALGWTDTAIYVGGHMRWMNNPYARDAVGNGAVEREGLAAVDPRSGATLTWNPGRTRGYGVYEFLATDGGIWITSDTDRIAGFQYRGRLAFMPLDETVTMPTEHTGVLPGQVVSLGLDQGGSPADLDRVTTRDFTGTSVTSAATAAGTEDWSSLRGAFMVDGELFTGWSDSTFRVQDYDGATFGSQSQVPLQLIPNDSRSLNRFASQDLSTVQGMFYDAATGRLYFTRSGSASLHHRNFSPQSRIVGAERYSSASNAAGINWGSVRTAFLADGKLYLATGADLVAYDWDPVAGLPTGAGTTVSGPGIDGEDWRARDAFVYAAADFQAPNQAPVAAFGSSCEDAVCEFDASTSVDPDGSIVGYAWDFGDDTAPGTGVGASHVYAASGTYPVTLTVTDDRGATTSLTQDVTVVVPNIAPVAGFTQACTGLECSFDSSTSSDLDGTIESHAWDFGDGNGSTDANPTHTYDEAGTYTVSLTVTDDQGGTNTRTTGVSVVDPNATPTVTFRAAAGANSNSTSSSLQVPAEVEAGDVMVLFASSNSGSATTTGPAGWTLLDSAASTTSTSQTAAWTKVATAADAGSTVTVGTSSWTKSALQLVAYDGAAGVSAHAGEIDTTSTSVRTTPTVNVTTPGSTLVSYWADKSGDNTGWELPGDVTLRNEAAGSGGGRIVAAVADSGPLGAGPAGGHTAESGSVNRRGMVWSVVVSPDASAPNGLPTASFTSSCVELDCTLDASASHPTDGTNTTNDSDLGAGATRSGVGAAHTYAAGTYTVTLTVTDDTGATNSTTRQVTAAPAATGNATFRAAASANGNWTSSTVSVPASVEPGDVMVLITTTNNTSGTVTGPAGWTLLDGVTDGGTDTQSHLWTRIADAGDAGSTATVTSSNIAKMSTQLAAYDNASGITSYALAFDTVVRAERTTPVVPVAQSGSALVSYWADKSSSTTTWAMPAGVELRELSVGGGGGRITSALGDTGSVLAGDAGGLTAVADSSNRRGVTWSIVIGPA